MINLSAAQKKDLKECDELQKQGIDMDCTMCTCSVCIAQVNDDLSLLKKAADMIGYLAEEVTNPPADLEELIAELNAALEG